MFAARHAGQWHRLNELASRRRLTGREADELVHLYRQGATQLSVLRSTAPDPSLVSQLSITLVKARGRIGSPHDAAWRGVARFLVSTIPAALYRMRWWSVAVSLACLGIMFLVGFWLAGHVDVLDSIVSPARQQQYAQDAFASYYSEHPNASFASLVWTNNARIAAICVATGITGIWPAYILFNNSVNTGVAGAVMHVQDADAVFWTLILPHGLLELSCVFVAGAAGLRLMWAWLVPGPRPRRASLAQEGRSTIVVVIALTIFLGLSGLLEGFVTPSTMDPETKIVIGALACAAFWVVTFWIGRRVTGEGADPTLTDEEAATEVATAG